MRVGGSIIRGFASAAAAATVFAASHAAAAAPAKHAEACVENAWGYLRAISDEWGTVDLCRYPVEIWFMPKDGTLVHSVVAPGANFRTGLTYPSFDHKTSGWITAVCRAGTVPSLDVSAANWDVILASNYSCRKP